MHRVSKIGHILLRLLSLTMIVAFFLEIMIFPISAQVLVKDSKHHIYDVERRTILRGGADMYLSLRYRHEWRNAVKGRGDLLTSSSGDKIMRNDRFRIYPELSTAAHLNGGNLQKKGFYIDFAPAVTVTGKYNLSLNKSLSVIGWTRLEKHSLVASEDFNLEIQNGRPVMTSDFSWDHAIGWSDMPGSNFSWVEYRLGEGGVIINYPGGDITFGKTVPIWSSGYSGQLWLSNKTSSLTFLGIRHSLSEKWSFAFLHGSLNSNIRDSTYTYYYPKGGGLPLVRKMIAVHRLDFLPEENIRIGIGESVVYGGRGIEASYVLPFVPYWTAQADLSNSDNLQIVVDWEVIKRRTGRLYGTIYLDEWDLVNTFSNESSRNWAAVLAGATLNLSKFLPYQPLLRMEWTHLSPYVYVHRSPINTFEHHGATLGHWIGPNGEGLFTSLEGRPSKNIWGQLYLSFARRGDVDENSINQQYRHEKVPFLYRSYEGEPEKRSVIGIKGEWAFSHWGRISIDALGNDWRHHRLVGSSNRGSTRKFDFMLQVYIGF